MTVYIIRAFVKMREVALPCPTSRQQLFLLLLCFPIRACSSCANASLYGLAEYRNEKLNMKVNQGVQISACSALLFLAIVLQAGAGDGASFVSATIPTNMVMAPGQTFTNTWTMQNTGPPTWSPTESGYTLNMAGTDSLGAVPLTARSLSGAYPPCASINGGEIGRASCRAR